LEQIQFGAARSQVEVADFQFEAKSPYPVEAKSIHVLFAARKLEIKTPSTKRNQSPTQKQIKDCILLVDQIHISRSRPTKQAT
jgi:hypothetical protein